MGNTVTADGEPAHAAMCRRDGDAAQAREDAIFDDDIIAAKDSDRVTVLLCGAELQAADGYMTGMNLQRVAAARLVNDARPSLQIGGADHRWPGRLATAANLATARVLAGF